MRGVLLALPIGLVVWALIAWGLTAAREHASRGELGPNLHLGARE